MKFMIGFIGGVIASITLVIVGLPGFAFGVRTVIPAKKKSENIK